MKLNLGSGRKQFVDWVNVDCVALEGVGVVHDLNEPLPFDDDSVEAVRAFHVIEHLDSPLEFLEEVWRVCKNEAVVELRFPVGAWAGGGDLTHKRFLSEGAIGKLYVDCPLNYYSKARFRELDKKLFSTPALERVPYGLRLLVHPVLSVFCECYLKLEVVKIDG